VLVENVTGAIDGALASEVSTIGAQKLYLVNSDEALHRFVAAVPRAPRPAGLGHAPPRGPGEPGRPPPRAGPGGGMSALTNIVTIAAQTFTEARRNRVFYSLFLFALVVVLSSIIFTEVTTTTMDRVLKDTGLAAINVFALALTIFAGRGHHQPGDRPAAASTRCWPSR
jgi:hypothetical protein